MENETSNIEEEKSSFCYSLEEEPGKKEPKKGISVTRALVMLGFDDWKDLEPGQFEYRLCHLLSGNDGQSNFQSQNIDKDLLYLQKIKEKVKIMLKKS